MNLVLVSVNPRVDQNTLMLFNTVYKLVVIRDYESAFDTVTLIQIP